VKRFYVNRGSRVKAGELLATLEDRDLAASEVENKGALSQAEAVYANATASGLPEEFRKAELDVEATRQGFEAEQKLYESREQLFRDGALARKLVDEAQVSYVQSRSQYETAQQHLHALRKHLEETDDGPSGAGAKSGRRAAQRRRLTQLDFGIAGARAVGRLCVSGGRSNEPGHGQCAPNAIDSRAQQCFLPIVF